MHEVTGDDHRADRRCIVAALVDTDSTATMVALEGDSVAIAAIRTRIERLARAEFALGAAPAPPVLITGDTGTGKELVARSLHGSGPRASQPFVAINCAAIPTHLLESECFGHERGAFTDARSAKAGLFEFAAGGTLFLDEIGKLDAAMQAKLLRAIETRCIRRVGALTDLPTNVRVMAATNRDLAERARGGQFRADLYYRLHVATIDLPKLADRGPAEVLLLARHFLQQETARFGRVGLRLSATASAALARHDWPGNVRELRHVIERAVMLAAGPEIDPKDLELDVPVEQGVAMGPSWQLPAAGIVLQDLEASMIAQAMQRCRGNMTRAAALLGLSRDTLRYRLGRRRDTASSGERSTSGG